MSRCSSAITRLWLLCLLTLYILQVYGINYPGGWVPSSSPVKQECVDICLHSNAQPTCPTGDPSCLEKKQHPGDYDFLTLEHMYVPQFCRYLLLGVDITISHRNVQPFPSGITCQEDEDVTKSEMTIHGLWPNYNAGYPACCNVSDTIRNHPFHAAKFAKRYSSLLAEMSHQWIDATQRTTYDTLCELYNHEFQKHGMCFTAYGDDYNRAAARYFYAVLHAASIVKDATQQINTWAASPSQKIPSLVDLQKLYPKRVQVWCSSIESEKNRLAAIHTCVAKPPKDDWNGTFESIDCKEALTFQRSMQPCDPSRPISLESYKAPSSILSTATMSEYRLDVTSDQVNGGFLYYAVFAVLAIIVFKAALLGKIQRWNRAFRQRSVDHTDEAYRRLTT